MTSQLRNHRIAIISYLGLGLLMAIVGLVFHRVASVGLTVEYIKYGVILLFFVNVTVTLKLQKLPVYHPYVMFLGVFGLFFMSRICLDILNLDNIAQTHQFSSYLFDKEVSLMMLVNVYCSLYAVQIGALVAQKSTRKFTAFPTQVSWKRVGLMFFYLGLPFLFYQNLMLGLEVLEKGYSAKLAGEIVYRNTFGVSIMSHLSYCGFLVYLASFAKNRWYFLHLVLFVAVYSLKILDGARYQVMTVLLVLLAYTYLVYLKKFKSSYIIIPILCLFAASLIIGVTRNKEHFGSLKYSIVNFVQEQGFALQIVGYAVEKEPDIDYSFKDMLALPRFRIDHVKARVTGDNMPDNKVEMLHRYGLLAHKLTYEVNPKALAGGWDMSSNYIAELYLLGGILALFVGNFLLGVFLVLGVDFLLRCRFGVLALLLLLPCIAFVPRYIFDFVTAHVTLLFFMSFVLVVTYLYQIFIVETRFRR